MKETLTLEFDGGSRGNPGPAGIGFVLRAADGTPLVARGRFIGRATNNVAEYTALISGLRAAEELGARKLNIRGDSELIIKQMNGEYRVRHPDMRTLYEEARELADRFEQVRFSHNLRHHNSLADALVNKAIDCKGEVDDEDDVAQPPSAVSDCAQPRAAVPQVDLRSLLDVALEAAHAAGRATLAHFNTGVAVEIKSDNTPVTVADRQAEQIIRRYIERSFPAHAILGEEGGDSGRKSDVRWIIDPIDGTKSFIHGVPLYSVLIGVEIAGEPSIGVIYLPALDELIWAATGLGCWWNGRPARVSKVNKLEDACVVSSSISSCIARSDAFAKLAAGTRLQRTWGDAYGYALVATGRAEVMIDAAMKPWDCAPLPPILREAGGHFTDWSGNATIWGADGLGTNAALHRQVLDILKTERRK